ncbi:MAG TPA: globin domain-containing protein [Aggregatilineales bacterium]|nr:hypothetical protein [Anaerolineales bacterium]HRE47414.1 globin domain-containing protein [Aggregatilineales bacterium]
MTALPSEQTIAVISSFMELMRDPDCASTHFYQKLFEINPLLRDLFKEDMKLQKAKFIQLLTMIIRSIDDWERATPMIHALAERHSSYGVHLADFRAGGEALIYAVKTCLGEGFTSTIDQAWREVYRHMEAVMSDAYNSMGADA